MSTHVEQSKCNGEKFSHFKFFTHSPTFMYLHPAAVAIRLNKWQKEASSKSLCNTSSEGNALHIDTHTHMASHCNCMLPATTAIQTLKKCQKIRLQVCYDSHYFAATNNASHPWHFADQQAGKTCWNALFAHHTPPYRTHEYRSLQAPSLLCADQRCSCSPFRLHWHAYTHNRLTAVSLTWRKVKVEWAQYATLFTMAGVLHLGDWEAYAACADLRLYQGVTTNERGRRQRPTSVRAASG